MKWTRIPCTLAATLVCALTVRPDASEAVINGSVDEDGVYAAVASINNACSSVLVAPRVTAVAATAALVRRMSITLDHATESPTEA